MHRTRHGLVLLFASFLFSFAGSCPKKTIEVVSVNVPFDNFRLDIPTGTLPRNIQDDFEFYAGLQADDFRLHLSISNLGTTPPDGSTPLQFVVPRVDVVDGDDNVIERIFVDGPVETMQFGGNTGKLRVVANLDTPAPNIVVEAATVERSNETRLPAVTPQLAKRVSAYPLEFDKPVDFALDHRGTHDDVFFFNINHAEGQTFDILLVGAASVLLGDPAHGFSHSSSNALGAFTSQLPFTGVVLTRITAPGTSTHITVSSAEIERLGGRTDPFRARLIVLPIGAEQRLSFPSVSRGSYAPFPIGIDTARGAGATRASCTNWNGSNFPHCYDDHTGNDFLLNVPPAMFAGVPVNAAARGVVVQTATGNVDTCFPNPDIFSTSPIVCPGTPATFPNFVHIRQDDGRIAMYYHLRNVTPPVVVGQRVNCGEFLGQAASSGVSAVPHLHFELRTFSPEQPWVENVDAAVFAQPFSTVIEPYSPEIWRTVTSTPAGPVPESDCFSGG